MVLGVKETLNVQSLSTRVPKILAKRNQGVPAKWVQELRPTRSLHCCYKYSSKTGHPEPQLPQGAGPSTEGTLSSPPSALTLWPQFLIKNRDGNTEGLAPARSPSSPVDSGRWWPLPGDLQRL